MTLKNCDRTNLPSGANVAIAWCLATGSLIGCDGSSPSARIFVDTLPTGTIVVQNVGDGTWDDRPWTLEEVKRIGDPNTFYNIRAVAVDRNSDVYVADRSNTVRVFDNTGALLRTIGQQGSGPGEFAWIVGMAIDPHQSLWVVDYRNARFSIFDASGQLRREVRRDRSMFYVPWPGRIDSSGIVHDFTRLPDVAWSSYAPVRLNASGDIEAVAALPVYQERHVPFAPRLLWTLAPSGDVWFGISDSYRLYKITFDGDTVVMTERDVLPAKISRSERRAAFEGWQARVGTIRAAAGTSGGQVVRQSEIPDTKPIFRALWVDSAGHLWVVLAETGGNMVDKFDIFDPAGRYLGRVESPELLDATVVPAFQGDQMYAVTRDDDDVPYVVQYAINYGR